MYRFQPFVDWVEENPFYIRDTWDFEKNQWAGPGRLVLSDFQKRVFGECLRQDENGKFPYETVIYSTIKKSGKTQISAAVAAWFADQAPDATEIYVVATTQEHAEGRVMRDLKYHYKKWSETNDPKAKIVQYQITLPKETTIIALPLNAPAVSGSRHGLTLWDELWGLMTDRDRRVWDELTPIQTVPYSLRFVSTYAGFIGESDLLWDLYKMGVGEDEHEDGHGEKIAGFEDLPVWKNGRMFTFWDHIPRMPWQTSDYYLDQIQQNRPAAYLRLHENRWVTTHETFIPIEWWDEAASHFPKPPEYLENFPFADRPVCIGVDGSTTEATTAVVGCTYLPKQKKAAILFHRIWKPSGDNPMDMTSVEDYILERSKRYNLISVGYDPAQLHQAMTHLARLGIPTHPIPQQGTHMVKASQTLYDLLKYKNLMAYPDDDLKAHIQQAVAEDTGAGFRIVKQAKSRTARRVIDAAVAMAIATYEAIDRMGTVIDEPLVIDMPFSDASAWKYEDPMQKIFPFPFRSD